MEIERYDDGVPSWVDMGSPDLAASKAFYGGLLGWECPEGPPEAGGYSVCELRGKTVAGLGPQMNPDFPAAWLTYVNVDSADDTIAKVKANGGAAFVEPMDVLDVGRMAVFADPAGAVLGLWQPSPTPAPSWSTSPARGVGASSSRPISTGRRRSMAPCSAGTPRSRGRVAARLHRVAGGQPIRRRHDGQDARDARQTCHPTGASTSPSTMPTRRWPRRRSSGIALHGPDGHRAGAHGRAGRSGRGRVQYPQAEELGLPVHEMRLHIHPFEGSGDGLCGFDQETKEPITVTPAEIIYQRRIAVLDYAQRSGNVAEACRVFGISRTRYYEWKNVADRYGLEALCPRRAGLPRCPKPRPPTSSRRS